MKCSLLNIQNTVIPIIVLIVVQDRVGKGKEKPQIMALQSSHSIWWKQKNANQIWTIFHDMMA